MAPIQESFVRELDSFEEFFWQLEQMGPVGNIAGAEVVGKVDLASWRAAWEELHRHHPALSFSIRKEDQRRPYFIHTGLQSPLTQSGTTNQSLTTYMEDALREGFASGNGSLTRLHIVLQEQSTSVVLVVHHALFDGVSLLVLLQHLLALLNGEEVVPSTLQWPSLRTVVGLPERPGYRNATATKEESTQPGGSEQTPPPALRVSHVDLSEQETSSLLQATRSHQTSVQGALLAAVALTGAEANPGWRSAPVSSNTAHNARPKSNRELLGMITTPIVSEIDVSTPQAFWVIAQAAQFGTLPGQTEEGHRRSVEIMDELTAEERSPLAFVMTLPRSPISYEMMVTNFAGYSPRTEFGSLRLTSLYTTVNGGPAMGTIGVCTLEGRLGITLITRQPVSGFQDELKKTLLAAC